jgi:hypothetical protein
MAFRSRVPYDIREYAHADTDMKPRAEMIDEARKRSRGSAPQSSISYSVPKIALSNSFGKRESKKRSKKT